MQQQKSSFFHSSGHFSRMVSAYSLSSGVGVQKNFEQSALNT